MGIVEIRKMQDDDWEAVARIYQVGIDSNLATFEQQCPSWQDWDSSHDKECRFVAVLNEQVVGWVAVTPVSNRCVYAGVAEISIYVDPAVHRMGVGKELLKGLCIKAEKEGYWTLQSGIMEDNTASIQLHESCGFRMVGYREAIGKDRFGKWRNTVLVERRNGIK